MTDSSDWLDTSGGKFINTNLDFEDRVKVMKAFFDWFSEMEGFAMREERFWDAFDRRDSSEVLTWLKQAWFLAYELGLKNGK